MVGMKDKLIAAGRGHAWRVTPKRARELQEELRRYWIGEDALPEIRTVAGLDAAFVLTGSQALGARKSHWNKLREANRAIGAVVLYEFPAIKEIERAWASVPLRFPYVPGLLSFREIPVLLAALQKLKQVPDLLFCDGQGIAHPRRFGLACHLGVLLDRPAIGCAKSLLVGTHGRLGAKAGEWTELVDEAKSGEVLGAVLRTRDATKPIYVSQGNRISLETALRLTLQVCDGFRIPKPAREADHFVSEVKRKLCA